MDITASSLKDMEIPEQMRIISEAISPLFEDVFRHGPNCGQFNFRAHSAYHAFYTAFARNPEYKGVLRGVIVCRSVHTGVWFPIFHFRHHDLNYRNMVPDGAAFYSYIEVE